MPSASAAIPGVEEVEPAHVATDFCLTCGKPIAYAGKGRRPKYCPEHRTTATGRTPARRARGVADPKATKVIGKILIISTMWLASQRLGKFGLGDHDPYVDMMTLTDDEADAIAGPLSRWSSNSKVGRKVIDPIVENEDLLDAGIALWEYNKRTTGLMRYGGN